jgi:hypothetical protein
MIGDFTIDKMYTVLNSRLSVAVRTRSSTRTNNKNVLFSSNYFGQDKLSY